MSDSDHRIVGVYESEEEAETAAGDARRAGGQDVSVDAPEDEVAALRGEMRDEVDHSFMGPGSVGPFTKEMTHQAPWWALGGALLGALVALPVGLASSGLPLVTRLIIALAVGATGGAVAGAIIGGGFFRVRRHAREPLAAERGVTVSARGSSETIEAMAERHPIRIDLTTEEGEPEDTVTTEEEQEQPPTRRR